MKNGKLYIPDGSVSYYIAVLLSFIGTAAFIWCNLQCYGALNLEFAAAEVNIEGFIKVEAWIYAVGALHLIANLSVPIGYILAKKKLWLAGIYGWGETLHSVVCVFALIVQAAIFVITNFLRLNDLVNFDMPWYETLLAFFLLFLLFGMVVFFFIAIAVITTAIFSALKSIPFAANAIIYKITDEDILHGKKLISVITALCWLAAPLLELFIAFCIKPYIGIDLNRLSAIFIPYTIHAAAAVLFGLSLKNKAVAEQSVEQAIPAEVPRNYKG
ncbi:MAG: hypothetical protein E7485_02520 [Ruminococcaceae bacterium]|nr:hypothetical protein [Oscillospiraceae bacterium]